ncbi:AraC family transcriptional regulator [Mesorhizobium sp.]|uniref:helix-turn-helix domain-containing protein n=1 Tax=Mesorhizobium sp. TaxID=1871066 RepID=UPI000FE6C9F4|nr:helix-turn-helix domain-containing protein [Mesorhizobium sp.]RWM25216.1 MAG: AraC family transcriptional regulator [Mesorhizobium sp.]RWM39094.1 MAG: AraC family transcriptional regulator [Mesorhizobium sp.]TJV52401.1 MAG: AraC family transcriptional regulator [Mesorhizobium sp.]
MEKLWTNWEKLLQSVLQAQAIYTPHEQGAMLGGNAPAHRRIDESRAAWMSGKMRAFQFLPIDVLVPYVDRIWGWESVGGERVDLPVLLPGTGAELYFHYRTPFRRSVGGGTPETCSVSHLFYVRRRPLELLPSDDVGFVAVRFRAGMIHRFVDMPGRDMMDRALSAEDLWGATGQELAWRVAGAEAPSTRLQLIQRFLAQRLSSAAPDIVFEHAMGMLYGDPANLAIDRLTACVGLGRRQLERRFASIAGQTPVEIRSLGRFQKTVRALMLDDSARATDAALAYGYYDQAHFIRHFRELVAESPQRYLKEARARTHFYNTSRCAGAMMTAPS